MDLSEINRCLHSLNKKIKSDNIDQLSHNISCILKLDDTNQEQENATKSVVSSGLLSKDLRSLFNDEHWECHAAAFVVAEHVIKTFIKFKCDSFFDAYPGLQDFWQFLIEHTIRDIDHSEPRVRLCLIRLVEQLAGLDGSLIWKQIGFLIFDLIDKNLEEKIQKDVQYYHISKNNSFRSIIDQTTEWKVLNTNLLALNSLIKGFGHKFVTEKYHELKNSYIFEVIIPHAFIHQNRHIRETCFHLCNTLSINLCISSKGKKLPCMDTIVIALVQGLKDNWSQVRFSASVATRSLILGLSVSERANYLLDLLPYVCLNRFYLAEGVRIYSQNTWIKIFLLNEGVKVVSNNINHFIDIYCDQSKAENSGVREATCYGIAELVEKIPSSILTPYINDLTVTILNCFQDKSWPVRDAACQTSAQLVLNYSHQITCFIPKFLNQWFQHLSDNIKCVRENCAIAIGKSIKAFETDTVNYIMQELPIFLNKVYSEDFIKPAYTELKSSKTERNLCPRRRVYGSLKNLHTENNKDFYNCNKPLYSCGSLATKLETRTAGCMAHNCDREKLNWEFTDGGIYLLRELALLKPILAKKFFNIYCNLFFFNNCPIDLHLNLLYQFVPILRALLKYLSKGDIDFLINSVTHLLYSDEQQLRNAAKKCIVTFHSLFVK